MMQMIRCFTILAAVAAYLLPVNSYSQAYSIFNNTEFDPITRELYKPGINFHTSVRPFKLNQVNVYLNSDSVIWRGIAPRVGEQNIWQRFLHSNLVHWEDKDGKPARLRINPMFNFELGREISHDAATWTNTRAIMIEGQLGENLAFYADLHENQGVFPSYIDAFIEERGVVPGQGRAKLFGQRGFDFSQSTGHLSFDASEWVNLKLGYGKNFIGDGHRSLLLSDNSFSYPYLKMRTTFWRLKYVVMVNQMLHLENTFRGGDERFEYKYGVFHYLTMNLGSRVSLGLFESVVWTAVDETGYRGLDFHYLIPVIVYRPVEYALGSPDNVVMGANLKVITWPGAAFYGQFVMCEFKLDEVFGATGWWANKQGFQAGFKAYNIFGLRNLDFQTEYNQVRPYTYTHYSPDNNYGHFGQELAHPLGANFRENVTFLRYRAGRWHFNLETMFAVHGRDPGDGFTYGGDIFAPSVNRPFSHGHTIGQGLNTTIRQGMASISFLVNPHNNMNVTLGGRIRDEFNNQQSNNSTHVWFALRTSLSNLYHNF